MQQDLITGRTDDRPGSWRQLAYVFGILVGIPAALILAVALGS